MSTSRREFLMGRIGGYSRVGHICLCKSADRKRYRLRAYVGTYTGMAGSGSNGEGIFLFEVSGENGELHSRRPVAKSPNPSSITIHPSQQFLYAVNEVDDYKGKSGSVSAWSIDGASGRPRALNAVSSEGAGPAYMSIDRRGRFAFVANYVGEV